jgi:uncharacterized protein YhfF
VILVLSPEHQLLRPEGAGTLESFTAAMKERGLELPPPCGVGPPDYVILLAETPDAPPGFHWVPWRDLAAQPDDRYWPVYCRLMLAGFIPSTKDTDVFSFGDGPFMAARLAHLVIKGKKRATSGSVATFEHLGLRLPGPGLVSIVTDGYGVPLCAIETERMEVRRFKEVPETVAIGEGEGDLTLRDWRRGHWKYFTEEATRLGLAFDEDSRVFTEWFRVLQVFGRPG